MTRSAVKSPTLGGAALQRCRKPVFLLGALAPEVALLASAALLFASLGCSRHPVTSFSVAKLTAYGSAIVESSGGKQTAGVGTPLPQPVVVQVNDDQGNGVNGALVVMRGPNGVSFDPVAGITDSSGQFTTTVM